MRLIRQRYREGAAKTIARLSKIAAGELTRTVATESGLVEEQPSFADQTRAADLLAKYGIGTQQEVTGADGGPVVIERQTVIIGGKPVTF